jgi:uncharacterized membrane protein YsdA (DUF1294 family)
MNPLWTIIIGWLVLAGFIGFIMIGIDKARAQDGSWRIPEWALFRLALTGGALGILAGSSVFHHKTLKDSFLEIVLVIAVGWLVVLIGLERLLGPPLG